ncbi:RNA polymerase sigma-I factor [Salimicrobium jeotgali]|uniref:RNA polymerase sigma factor SigI n=2 Tax=Salimicrobium TaxID=351195 RepID=K2G8G6_9BACI|nr:MULTISPECIES: RNA polymerase sigma-I factor [Salimicrobium]AKG05058.1 RNA polymerase sigma-I factor [Salimicrobium jeotgali]EKE30632.1 RNA polymerase sigma factor SigI [Salimicrobium jeotgali]MBM7696867.1 RNA polymerase sigma factor [Salimicrobium jeotgali]SIS44253.1 RNA polymerase sigma factor [Salimicrobium salexigens]
MSVHLFTNKESALETQVTAAQFGDEEIRHELISKYQPFVAKCVSEVCKKYISPSRDDEFSIGLIAFNDAIDSYVIDKGAAFLSFAKLVIKRRVIDYIRQQTSPIIMTSINNLNDQEEKTESPAEVQISREKFEVETEAWYRRTEIEEFQQQLRHFRLSFKELTEVAPRHRDARESALKVAHIVFHNEELRTKVLSKGRLPIKELSDKVTVSKKTLERNRKYIISLVLILSGDYVYLKDYLKGVDV